MPINPFDNNIIFLSTSEILDQDPSVLVREMANRIYSYNLQTSELTPLYYEVAHNNSPFSEDQARMLRIVGREGTKVIILYDAPGNSPGPCTDIWSEYADHMGYLDFRKPEAGLRSYSVPAAKIEEGKRWSEQCLLDIQADN